MHYKLLDMNISDDPHFKLFCKSRNLQKSTIQFYHNVLKRYCEYLQLTPTQFIEEAENEEEERIRMKKRKIKWYFIEYMDLIEEAGMAFSTRKKIQSTIRTFYREFEIELPRTVRLIHEDEELITTDSMIQKEHIEKAYDRADVKYKAIIKLIMSSGMGASEITNLTYKDFLNSLNLQEDKSPQKIREEINSRENIDKIPCWKIRRYKTKMPYFTFSSPESVEAILNYLDDMESRERYITPDMYLFTTSRMEQIGPVTLTTTFRKINDRCGFGKLGKFRFFRSHNLRKYFATSLYTAGVREKTIDWLLGHKIIVVNGRYIKSDIEAVKLEYLKGLDALSLEKVDVRVVTSKELQEMEDKNKALQKQINHIEKALQLDKELKKRLKS